MSYLISISPFSLIHRTFILLRWQCAQQKRDIPQPSLKIRVSEEPLGEASRKAHRHYPLPSSSFLFPRAGVQWLGL